ncbi:uncharacterized protein BO80DRAFT_427334 [Aspergillus ibericus CBS 121593]|uniref:Uncharacterized protein n=1 Tax=Aspergillus ibericus CBS 121593 TaxID=1448316 RepID=A0A395GV22_9EURO|nr:hypothetical protein BO80DRAFT_427334 [Aspergillus ibericus CBS 121593]RAK98527.1 hypothetical protein BO80DRAFT_427334 [Aspergillus ibericus CBS 121593]
MRTQYYVYHGPIERDRRVVMLLILAWVIEIPEVSLKDQKSGRIHRGSCVFKQFSETKCTWVECGWDNRPV